jgi:hypothetical protein
MNDKKIYYVRYKWTTNDRDWLTLPARRVAATSQQQAAETMFDAHIESFIGSVDLMFMVSISENQAGLIFNLSNLSKQLAGR